MSHKIKGWSLNTKGVDPEAVASELSRIEVENDGLRPEEVVAAARPKRSPLHALFDWDDAVAGQRWRIQQARNLIRSIRVSVESVESESVRIRAYQNVPGDAYRSTSVVVSREDMYAKALSHLMAKWQQAREAVRELQQAAQEQDPDDADRLARINLALEAFRTAGEAIKGLAN